MRDYLQSLLNDDLDLQSDELTIADEEIIQGDISEEISGIETETEMSQETNIENLAVTETAAEVISEDDTTLESLICGLRSSIPKNNGLTIEGAAFANNHIQSICKRYDIKVEANINNESSKDDNGRLTLEAAEEAKETLWQRFKNAVKAAFTIVMDFLSGLLKTKAGLVKAAESIIARANKVTSSESVTVEVNSKTAFFLNSINALPAQPSGADVVKATKENLQALLHAAAPLSEIERTLQSISSNSSIVEKNEDGTYSESAISEAVAARINSIVENGAAHLPFGKTFSDNKLKDQNPAPSKAAFSVALNKQEVIAIAKNAKDLVNSTDSFSQALKESYKIFDAMLKMADANIARRVYAKVAFRFSGFRMSRALASLSRNSAIVCMKLADSALKKLEAK